MDQMLAIIKIVSPYLFGILIIFFIIMIAITRYKMKQRKKLHKEVELYSAFAKTLLEYIGNVELTEKTTKLNKQG